MYGMLYIKTDSTPSSFSSFVLSPSPAVRLPSFLFQPDSHRAKTNFEKCQKKTQQNGNKRKTTTAPVSGASGRGGQKQEKDICAASATFQDGWIVRRDAGSCRGRNAVELPGTEPDWQPGRARLRVRRRIRARIRVRVRIASCCLRSSLLLFTLLKKWLFYNYFLTIYKRWKLRI